MCGHQEWQLIARGEDFEYGTRPGPFKIVECSRCKHVYLHPLPTPEEIPFLYPPTYYTVNRQSPNYIKGFILEIQTKMGVNRTLKFMQEHSIASIVDIGCGNAHRLLKLADVLGNKVELIGLDLQHDPATIAEAQKKGITLVEGNLESDLSALKDGGHDFIIMNQVVEHLCNPVVALEAIQRKLSPGGLLLIETPNVGGFDYRLFRQKYWGHWHIPRHLNLFTQPSLARLATQTGFHVIQQGYLPSPGPWILSLRNSIGLNSIKKSRGSIKSLAEFICFRNLFVVGFFTFLDTVTIKLGLPTSNQFMIATKE
jgi:2-polyprenyl-3-methyl-5-hydroxy-6-metoxy-1,4-benzoquinol methylase